MAPSATADAPAPVLHIRFDKKVPIVQLPADLDFEALRVWLAEQVPEHADTLGGRTARLDLGGRTVQLLELRRLIHFLRENWDIEITGLYVLPDVLHRFAERELRLKLFVHDAAENGPVTEDVETEMVVAPEDLEAEVDEDDSEAEADDEDDKLAGLTLPNDLEVADIEEEPGPALPEVTHADGSRRTLSIHRTLRSGTVVRFDGDVYVFGDVNPGAQVVATGNLVVLGALKGMAWAGAAGEDDAFILAHLLRPTQLRIGRKIAIVPERDPTPNLEPEMASIVDGQIATQPYHGRIRG